MHVCSRILLDVISDRCNTAEKTWKSQCSLGQFGGRATEKCTSRLHQQDVSLDRLEARMRPQFRKAHKGDILQLSQ